MTIGTTIIERLRALRQACCRTRRARILSIGVVLALILVGIWIRTREPSYEGRPISYWIAQLEGDNSDKAAEALAAIGAPATPYLVEAIQIEMSASFSQLLEKLSDVPFVGKLADKLTERRSRRQEIPDAAAEVLVTMREHANKFVPALVRIYQNPKGSEEVIERAADILTDLGVDAASSMPSYLAHLRSRDLPHKTLTLSILSALGPAAREAVPLLTNLFNGDGANDLSCAEALWNIDRRTNDVVQACQRILQARNLGCPEDLTTRVTSLLARMGPAAGETIPILRDLVLKGPATTRFPAEWAMRSIDAPRLEALYAEANLLARQRIEKIVASLGQQNVWAPTPERTNFFNALPAIAALGPEARPACARLVELLRTPPPSVSKVEEGHYRTRIPLLAAWALGQIGDTTDWVVSALASHLKSTDPFVARACSEALGKLGPPAGAAAPALRELLEAEDVFLRLEAAMALVTIAPETATAVEPVLRELEKVEDPRVRNAAKLALWKIEHGSDAASTIVPIPDPRVIVQQLRLASSADRHKREMEGKEPSPLEALMYDSLDGLDLDRMRLLGWVGPKARGALPQLIGIATTNYLPSSRLRAANAIRRIDPATYEKLRLPGPLALPENPDD